MRVGLFGGTFDPPHVGHLLVAGDAVEALGLDRLLWIPAGRQPLKVQRGPLADGEQRAAMVALTIAGDTRFVLERTELDRPGLSYMVDTVRHVAERMPEAELVLLLGQDAWALFDRWREPEAIRRMARVAVMRRDGSPGGDGEAADVDWVTTRRVDVSATEIRQRVVRGVSIRGFVVDDVAEYIESTELYR